MDFKTNAVFKAAERTFAIDHIPFCVCRSWNFILVVRIFNEVL